MQMPTDAAPPLVSLYQNPIRGYGRDREEGEHARVGLPGGVSSGFLQALNDIHRAPIEATDATTKTNTDTSSPLAEGVLDTLNPMHHLPVVSSFYRSATGDEISGPARLAGGALFGSLLFGGPVGLGLALANVVSEELTGRDIGGNALAFLGLEQPAGTATAEAAIAARNRVGSDLPGEARAESKSEPDANTKNTAGGKGPLSPLYQHLDVTRWAEQEAQFRNAQAERHNAGASPRASGDDRTAENQLVGSLMAGVQQNEILNAARQYGATGTLGGASDTLPAGFDMES